MPDHPLSELPPQVLVNWVLRQQRMHALGPRSRLLAAVVPAADNAEHVTHQQRYKHVPAHLQQNGEHVLCTGTTIHE